MPRRVSVSTLNASTMDILNTIRQNAGYEYQSLVPEVTKETDIPRVGEVLVGYPSLANQFINALINRIALVRVKSATFNNAYAMLKKGYLEMGEVVEEVFVNICKAREFSVEKAAGRELKRSVPDVRSAFHAMNWRVQYPVTIQEQDLQQAFLSMSGVQDLIARIVDAVYTAAEYDEFLLFKYLIIKAFNANKIFKVHITGTTAAIKNDAAIYRGYSNALTFMSDKYNASGVTTITKKEDQYLFMDTQYNAQYDVEVLASAFNMGKADYQGRLTLIDSFSEFDNDRFSEIVANSDMLDPVTPAELTAMQNVKAILFDSEWFQVYDNLTKFTETYVASGMYWNYFLNMWKTVSYSPFSNCIAFTTEAVDAAPDSITIPVVSVDKSDTATVVTFGQAESANKAVSVRFVQTQQMVEGATAVHPYGAIIYQANAKAALVQVAYKQADGSEKLYVSQNSGGTAAATFDYTAAKPGDTVTFKPVAG